MKPPLRGRELFRHIWAKYEAGEVTDFDECPCDWCIAARAGEQVPEHETVNPTQLDLFT